MSCWSRKAGSARPRYGPSYSGRYPVRNVEQTSPTSAQVAANEKGAHELNRMVAHFGLRVVHAYMRHVQDNAEEQVRRVIDVLKDGMFAYEMDDGAVVRVAIRIDAITRSATIDFTGTSPQQASNFNAPPAVAKAAVLYVFRTLVDDDIPLNAGCLKPLRIIIPEGSMLSPRYPAPVVAGNVETSQMITDALYGALGVMAAARGDDEQLRSATTATSITRRSAAAPGPGPISTGRRRAHAHDEYAIDRPGGPAGWLSGCCCAALPFAAAPAAPAPPRRLRRGSPDRV